jgi:beta-aspartyl-peptidase (threonine type)
MWALILHGGARRIAAGERDNNRRGCRAAIEAGIAVLRSGGSSIDAVETSVRSLEDDPTFNAGRGSARNADGEVEMCAAIMEGKDFNVGAVTVISGVRHPVSVARSLLYEEPILLAGDGARRYARDKGLELCEPANLSVAAGKGTHDTVGCIALDAEGRLAVATSTGGLDGSPAGRVGDSPQPGCGFYADDAFGAVAFSGDGEHIARRILAGRVMHSLALTDPESALADALEAAAAGGGEAGGIVLTREGQFGWAHNSDDFAVALASHEYPAPRIFLNKAEEAA